MGTEQLKAAVKGQNPMRAVDAPLASMVQSSSSNAVANTDQQRAVAEVQAAMMIARMNPREEAHAMDKILTACMRPTLADAAIYEYARGGSNITGPSIRLAEAIAQSWGNMQFGIRELEQRRGESTVQAYAWDVENNTRREVTFQVSHIRHTKKGVTVLDDPRDIYEMVANQGARRLRSCILAVVPGDVTQAAVEQCEATMKTKLEVTPEFIQSVVESFQKFGVTKEQLEARIQRRIDTLTPALAVQLKKISNSLRDGMSAPADWFGADEQTAAVFAQNREQSSATQPGSQDKAATPPQGGSVKEAGHAASDAPAGTAGPVAQAIDLPEAIRGLDAHTDVEIMSLWADTLPNEIRANERFTTEFRAAVERIKRAMAKK